MIGFSVLLPVAWAQAEARRMQALALWGLGFALVTAGTAGRSGKPSRGARACGRTRPRWWLYCLPPRRLRRPVSGWAGNGRRRRVLPQTGTRLSVLRNIEQKIGGLFEGVFSRTFRSTVQPVELARKLAKEMDDHKTISIHRVYVPDEYTLYLNPADREQFAAYETQMRNELAEYLVEHARREGYSLAARPLVLLETDDELAVGTFGIAVSTQSPASAAEAAAHPSPQSRTPGPRPAAAARAAGGTAGRRPAAAAAATPPLAAGATMIYAPARAASSEPEPEPEPEARPETATLEWSGGTFMIEQRVVDDRPLERVRLRSWTTPTSPAAMPRCGGSATATRWSTSARPTAPR